MILQAFHTAQHPWPFLSVQRSSPFSELFWSKKGQNRSWNALNGQVVTLNGHGTFEPERSNALERIVKPYGHVQVSKTKELLLYQICNFGIFICKVTF
jgi:hypothetical protein